MTELTQEQLAEIRQRHEAIETVPSAATNQVHIDRRALLHHIDAQAARIAELERKVREARGRLAALNPAAIDALRADNQQQLDDDGVMVGVSRQAADETVATLDNLRAILEGDEA